MQKTDMCADVIILGAGAAGLLAAKMIGDGGLRVLLLEARERIGGRILSMHDDDSGPPVEMGAEFIHGRPAVTFDLVREAMLIAYDLPFEQHERRDGSLKRMADDEMAPVMKRLAKLGRRDMSFADFLKKYFSDCRFAHARQAAADFVEGFDAADIERISAKSLAEEQEGLGDVEDEMQFRLLKGYGALVRHLHDSLDRRKVEVCLGSVVEEILWRPQHVAVRCRLAGQPQEFEAPKTICTLPLGVLKQPAGGPGSVRFTPELPTKCKAAALLESGPVVKAVVQFREPFWERPDVVRAAGADGDLRDASFLHDSSAPFPTWWTTRPLRLPILTGWAGGPKAAALSGRSQSELLAAAIHSLAELFNLRKHRIRSMILKTHIYDWLADPFSRGAYSYVAVGGVRARAALARPIDRTLFFAGEATDTSGQASTVAGALASGKRVAREVLQCA